MTAGMIDAQTAKDYGLVNHVCISQEELLPLAEKIAGKIMRNSSVAIKSAIKAINANYTDGCKCVIKPKLNNLENALELKILPKVQQHF